MNKKNKDEFYEDEKGYLRETNNSNAWHRKVAYHKIYLKNLEKYTLPFSKYEVHHIDGDKQNNLVENLALLTTEEHIDLHQLIDQKIKSGLSRKNACCNSWYDFISPKKSVYTETYNSNNNSFVYKNKNRTKYNILIFLIVLTFLIVGFFIVNKYKSEYNFELLNTKSDYELCMILCSEECSSHFGNKTVLFIDCDDGRRIIFDKKNQKIEEIKPLVNKEYEHNCMDLCMSFGATGLDKDTKGTFYNRGYNVYNTPNGSLLSCSCNNSKPLFITSKLPDTP